MSKSIAIQDRINTAYNSASNVRILAGAMWMFFLFSLIPFIGIIGRIGFYLAFAGVPLFSIIWMVRYGNISKSEPDIAGARKYLLTALGIWALYPVMVIVFVTLVSVGAFVYESSK